MDRHADASSSSSFQERSRHVVVDSASRNTTLYPTPTSYEVTLDSTVNDVVSVELVNVYLPFTMPLVCASAGNTFVMNGTIVTVPEGNYANKDVTVLVAAIDRLVNLRVDSDFGFAFDDVTEKFMFTSSSSSLTMDFGASGVLADILGFQRRVYTSTANAILATHRKNLNAHAFQNTIVMRLNDYARVVSNNAALDTCFCTLMRHDDVQDMRCKHVLETPKLVFHPALNKVSKLKVTFTDLAGKPYDFDGQDHHFELLFRFREPVLRRC